MITQIVVAKIIMCCNERTTPKNLTGLGGINSGKTLYSRSPQKRVTPPSIKASRASVTIISDRIGCPTRRLIPKRSIKPPMATAAPKPQINPSQIGMPPCSMKHHARYPPSISNPPWAKLKTWVDL